MNRPILSMIICLSAKSLDINYYINILKEFKNNFGYHLQIDGTPFKYSNIEEILKLLADLEINSVGIRTSEKLSKHDIELVKKYSIRSVMFRHGDECLVDNIKLAQANDIPVEISFILQKHMIEKIDEIIQDYQNKNITLLVLEKSIIAKYRNKQYAPLNAEDYKMIMKKIIKYNHQNNKMGIAISHCPNKILLHQDEKHNVSQLGGCSAGIVSCVIDDNGNVIPCLPLYKIVLGNIKEKTLYDIWNNSKICIKLRNRNNLKGKCGKCEYKNLCGGCRAESLYLSDSLFNDDKTCWKDE